MIHGKRRGQISVEALLVVSVILLIITVVFFALHERNVQNEKTRQLLEAQQEADKISSIVNNAVVVGDGYARNTTVKQTIGGRTITSYMVNRNNKSRTVTLQWTGPENTDLRVTAPLLSSDVHEANLTGTNRVTVKNENGTVTFTKR